MAMPRHALRRRREQQGWTQERLAHALGVETSTYRSWEAGRSEPRVGRRRRLAEKLDISLTTLGAMLDGQPPSALNGHSVPRWLDHLASLEQGAAQISAFEPVVVHGLLQTAAYAMAVESVGPSPVSPEAVAQKVATRAARQAVLERETDPLELAVVLDESVLYRVAGDHVVMAAQLDHLVAMADRSNIDVQILPLDAGVFSAAFGAFTVLTSPGSDEPYMAVVEDREGPHYLDRESQVEAHSRLFEYLSGMALSPQQSTDLIIRIRKERYR